MQAVTGPCFGFLSTLSLRRATALVNMRKMLSPVFLSTLSLRRATTSQVPTWFGIPNFYPRSPCGERRCDGRPQSGWTNISIHALLAESDGGRSRQRRDLLRFLSTLSLRRATAGNKAGAESFKNFYPRSPCGERHVPLAVPDFG